jgi:hypothetical protein
LKENPARAARGNGDLARSAPRIPKGSPGLGQKSEPKRATPFLPSPPLFAEESARATSRSSSRSLQALREILFSCADEGTCELRFCQFLRRSRAVSAAGRDDPRSSLRRRVNPARLPSASPREFFSRVEAVPLQTLTLSTR